MGSRLWVALRKVGFSGHGRRGRDGAGIIPDGPVSSRSSTPFTGSTKKDDRAKQKAESHTLLPGPRINKCDSNEVERPRPSY